jgi:hypothetical protein
MDELQRFAEIAIASAGIDAADMATAAAHKAAPGEQLTREQIREVFMAHGFTIKEGQTDLKQYVYDAAHALLGLVAAPQQEAQEPVGKYLTVVYRDLTRDEAQALIDHEKMSAASWSHALHERDMAKAAPQQAPAPLSDAQIKELIEDGVFLGNCKEIVRAIEHAHGITQKGGSNAE